MKLVGKGIYTNERGNYAEIRKTRDGEFAVNLMIRTRNTVRKDRELKRFKGFPAAKAWLSQWMEKA